MNWFDLLPKHIAKRQIAWERKRDARRMRALGFTGPQIGARFGVGRHRAWQLTLGPNRPSPAQRWLKAHLMELSKLADVAKQH